LNPHHAKLQRYCHNTLGDMTGFDMEIWHMMRDKAGDLYIHHFGCEVMKSAYKIVSSKEHCYSLVH
jgi:hypothetical protein